MSTPTGDTSSTPAASSEGGEFDADAAAQQALADAAREADGGAEDDGDDDSQFDADRARKKIEKANREARALRERIKALEPLAQEAEQRRKGEQTEAQRLAEEKAALEVELAELRTTNVRREAAEAANLPAKFVKFITAAEPDEALEQAKELAKALKGATESQRPDYRQGARGSNNAGSTLNQDDLIRRMAKQR